MVGLVPTVTLGVTLLVALAACAEYVLGSGHFVRAMVATPLYVSAPVIAAAHDTTVTISELTVQYSDGDPRRAARHEGIFSSFVGLGFTRALAEVAGSVSTLADSADVSDAFVVSRSVATLAVVALMYAVLKTALFEIRVTTGGEHWGENDE
jgi:hypothetical protein